jgi:hypothetical protein
MAAQQSGRRFGTEVAQREPRVPEMPAANEPVPVLQPAPPIPTLRPADPKAEDNLREIRALWASLAIGLSFWVAFGVVIWASLR